MLNHIDYIYEIYKEGSFTKAAEKLFVSQPALSLAIKKLEDEIGYPLFERRGKRTVPTEYGEKYVQAIEKIKRIREDLENEINEISELLCGRIRLGSTTFISIYILPYILKEFKEQYPKVNIELSVDQSTVLSRKLENDEVDIIIDNVLKPDPEAEYRALFDESILIGIPDDSPINERLADYLLEDVNKPQEVNRRIKVEWLRDESFILLKAGNSMRDISENIFRESGIEPKVSMEFDMLLSAISYAECGFGICLLTDTALRSRSTTLKLYVPDTAFSSRTVYLIRKKNRYTGAAVGEFIRFVESKTKSKI